jgi:hypothetical protein
VRLLHRPTSLASVKCLPGIFLACAADYGMRSNSRPAGTFNASARITIVGNRGARLALSIFEIAVVCRPEARERSSWDQPRSARSSLRLAAKHSSGLTADSFWVLAQEAKRHIVKSGFRLCCARMEATVQISDPVEQSDCPSRDRFVSSLPLTLGVWRTAHD